MFSPSAPTNANVRRGHSETEKYISYFINYIHIDMPEYTKTLKTVLNGERQYNANALLKKMNEIDPSLWAERVREREIENETRLENMQRRDNRRANAVADDQTVTMRQIFQLGKSLYDVITHIERAAFTDERKQSAIVRLRALQTLINRMEEAYVEMYA